MKFEKCRMKTKSVPVKTLNEKINELADEVTLVMLILLFHFFFTSFTLSCKKNARNLESIL